MTRSPFSAFTRTMLRAVGVLALACTAIAAGPEPAWSQESSLPAAMQPLPSNWSESPLDLSDEPVDFFVTDQQPLSPVYAPSIAGDPWAWQLLPQGLVYRSYLAGEKESRFRSVWAHDQDLGWIWDISLGGRVGILRYGSMGRSRPVGWQLDIEGAGMPRLDLEEDNDLVSADFRFGIPLTYGNDYYQVKLAYYHLSSHLGDEFLLDNTGFPRLNYSRDVLVWGHSIYPHENLRLYAEAGWALNSDVSEPWEFQFGVDYSPAYTTGLRGAPFVALNGAMREEVDFGGNVVVQAGWAWRGCPQGGLFRTGFQYYQGKSDQFSFFDFNESKAGIGIWYDY